MNNQDQIETFSPDATATGAVSISPDLEKQNVQSHTRGRTTSDATSTSSSARTSIDSVISTSGVGVTLQHVAKDRNSLRRTTTGQSSIVPRNKRRGLLGRFTIVPEVDDPHEYSRTIKWYITAVVGVAGMNAPMCSAIFFPALETVAKDLHTQTTVTNLSVALFILSMGICPIWWSAVSDTRGRRTVYIISFSLFVVFNICCAVSPNIACLIAFRLASGGAAASVQAVGAGTISDIWESRERGTAMGYFYMGPLTGPLIAPVIGGALAQHWGWRSTMYFMAMYGFVSLIGLIFLLPETLRVRVVLPVEMDEEDIDIADDALNKELEGAKPSVLKRTISRASTRTKMQKNMTKATLTSLRILFIDPLKGLKYLQYPPVFLTIMYAAVAFASLYMLNVSLQSTFSHAPYNYKTSIVGLLYLPTSFGYLVGAISGGRWSDHVMNRAAAKSENHELKAEDRMAENVWIAAVLYPVGLLWYGWTANYGVHVAAPMVACFFFGFGSMIIFANGTTMLTEFIPGKSATGVAINNLVRNTLSCVGAIVAQPLINVIGNGWLFTILTVVSSCVSFAVLIAMPRYAPRWRQNRHKYGITG